MKRYYKIMEASKIVGVETTTIRFWERELGKLHYKRSVRGDRLYTSKNIDLLKRIYELRYVTLMTLKGVKKLLF